MNEVTMFSSEICRYCGLAESLLSRKGVLKIKKILVNHDDDTINEMIEKTGRRTTPQIFIGDRHIGGFDDLVELDRAISRYAALLLIGTCTIRFLADRQSAGTLNQQAI